MLTLKLAIRGVTRRGAGLLLIILPSALLFAMVTFLLATRAAVNQLLEPGITQRSFRMGSSQAMRDNKDQYFTEADVASLGRVAHVLPAPASFHGCGVDMNELNELNCGFTNRPYIEMWDSNIHVPPEGLDKWDSQKNGAIVTTVAAARRGWKVGDHISLHRNHAPANEPTLDLEISYITDRYIDPRMLYYHIEYRTERLTQLGRPAYWVVWGLVDKPENRQAVMDEWDEKMKLVRPHLLSTMEATKQALLNGSRVLRESFEVAGMLSAVLVIFLSIALTTLYVEQRTTEMAAMRAIGYRRGTLTGVVLLEGLLTLPPAAFLGAMAIWFPLHAHPLVFEAIFRVTVHASNVLETVAYGAAIGLLSAAVPAWRVYRLDILGALR